MNRRIITCACCGLDGPHEGRGLRSACHRRLGAAGRLDEYPSVIAGRVEDYAELRSWGLDRYEAAARLGVSRRTTHRYDRHLDELEGAA